MFETPAPENPYAKPGLLERSVAKVARTLITSTLGAVLNQWGPQDLLIAISLDVDIFKETQTNFPRQLSAGKTLAALFPKAQEEFAGAVVFEWLKKNYPQLYIYTDGGVPMEVLASAQGKAWLFRNVERFRSYLWG